MPRFLLIIKLSTGDSSIDFQETLTFESFFELKQCFIDYSETWEDYSSFLSFYVYEFYTELE